MTAKQTRDADAYTIANEPIAPIDLMERAAIAFVDKFVSLIPLHGLSCLVCCGTGNNGGDGLAIARLLYERGLGQIAVWIVRYNSHETEDFKINYQRLSGLAIPVKELKPANTLPIVEHDIVIDAMLGSGLNKTLTDDWALLVTHINKAKKRVIAVDIPTGMPADGNITPGHLSVFAQDVITFQRPKISFLFPESAQIMKVFHVVDIGLDELFIENLPSDWLQVTEEDVASSLKERGVFSHKGTFGHALLVAGNENTMGAALLSAEACLFTGAGLTTLHIPRSGFTAMNARLPEVMLLARSEKIDLAKFNALAIGPGLGTATEAYDLFKGLILAKEAPPMVLDADALNMLAQEPELLNRLPSETILTPHMKEFDRLFGESSSWLERVQKAKKVATERELIILLKNRFTFIAVPEGRLYINFTGNPGMAIGGMGDTLTGILVSLLAQGYAPSEASIIGCYIHGLAGDIMNIEGWTVIPPSVLIQKIPKVIGDLKIGEKN